MGAALWVLNGLEALVLAVTIMVQWFLWLALTSQVWAPWGMAIGGLIVAVQIWLLFGTATPKNACELPK